MAPREGNPTEVFWVKRFAKCGFVLVLLMLCMTVFAAAAETTTISGKLVSATGDPIKLTGTGGCRIFSLVREYYSGSELRSKAGRN